MIFENGRKKNRGEFFLGEETLKILIAVICIVFLVYLIVSIWSAKVNGDNLKQAKALLTESENSVGIIINSLKEGETKTRDIIEPRKWSIFSFSDGDIKPNSCGGINCVCVCDEITWEGFSEGKQQEKCSEKGACLAVENLGKFQNIKITGELKIINITKTGGEIYFSG